MFNYLFYSLFRYNEFTRFRQGSLHFDSIRNPTYYESISVTWANVIYGISQTIKYLIEQTKEFEKRQLLRERKVKISNVGMIAATG